MKVRQEKYEQSKPKAVVETPPVPVRQESPEINVTNNIDLEELTKVVRAMGKTDSLENVIFALKDEQVKASIKHTELIKYLSDKMDVLAEYLREKPTAFEFDVKRNNNGFINTILVKPVK